MGTQHPEFHSTGQPALIILAHAGPTAAWFPYGNDDFIRPAWIEKQKIVKNVGKLTFLRKKMLLFGCFSIGGSVLAPWQASNLWQSGMTQANGPPGFPGRFILRKRLGE